MSQDERFEAKLKAAVAKAASAAPKLSTMPQRIASKSRIRATEERGEFAPWVSNLTPGAGLQNDFRTMLFRNELRTLENRKAVNNNDARLVRMKAPVESLKPSAPRYPGIQLFFQNTIDHSPLPVPAMAGGALTQLSRTTRGYRSAEDKLIELAKEQARQKTATRSDMPVTQTIPIPVTALDEAKLLIASELETIGQQLFRGLYTTQVLRDLGRIVPSIARNAPLMSAYALQELNKYVSDLAATTLANSKNIGKEIAEDAMEDAAQVAGAEEDAPPVDAKSMMTVTIGDIPEFVEDKRTAAEAIYARLESISEFLQEQAKVATEVPAVRIATAQANLPILGLARDRKRYPAAARELFARNEREEAAKQAAQAEAAENPPVIEGVYEQGLPVGLEAVGIEDIPEADVFPTAMIPQGLGVNAASKKQSADILDALLDALAAKSADRDGPLFALLGEVVGKPIITTGAFKEQKLANVRKRSRDNNIYLTQPSGNLVSFDTVANASPENIAELRKRYDD